jgi:two-component system, sensor histidine kinase YesM
VKIRSIQLSIIIGFTALITVTILTIGALAFYLFGDTLRRNSLDNTFQVVTQLNRVIDNYISNMDDISQVVVHNVEVQNYIQAASKAPFGQTRAVAPNGQNNLGEKASSLFQSIISVHKDIDSIMLLLDNKTVVTDQLTASINPFAVWPVASSATPIQSDSLSDSLSSSYVQDFIMGKYTWVITLRRDVFDEATYEHKGILLVNMNYRVIEGLCSDIQLGKSGYVFIINPAGEIVFHPRQQQIYSGLKNELIDRVKKIPNGQLTAQVDGREVLYTTRTSQYTGWTVVGVSYLDELFYNYNQSELEYYFAMIAVTCFLASVLISFFISVRISRPIEVLRQSMQTVERGNFDIDIVVNSTDEVNSLAQDFNIAIRKIKELIAQNALAQEQKRKHELKALQAQINPHFLYNTLDSIIWMIECGQGEDAIQMTSTLAKFFRLGISKGGDIITVRDEIEHLNCYLAIQKMRYKDRLDYSVEVNPEIHSFQTLKLLIQPLVENAIYHGLKTQDRIGMLRVVGDRVGDDLIFKVIDNGRGMTKEELSELSNAKPPSKGLGGVGVANVRERIQLHFGISYGVKFESENGKWTVATIRLPAISKNEMASE